MLKVFATQVVVSRGYDGAAAIKFSEKGDAVRFRIGKKVYDPNAENNARWINLAVKGFGPICERIKKMQLKYPIGVSDIVDADEWLSKNDISIGKESSNWHEQIDTYIDDLDGEDVLVSVDYHM